MQIADLDADFINYTNTMGTVALRKLARELGLKGLSSARGETIRLAIREAYDAHQAEIEAAELEKEAEAEKAKAPKKNACEDCGRRVNKKVHPELCEVCYDYAGWENTHQDGDNGPEGHEGCPICHPELDKRFNRREGRSRAGMEIVARGTEVHKSETFKVAASAAGWTVTIGIQEPTEADEVQGDTRYVAMAVRGDDSIELAWRGRAYDYPNSAAHLGGKDRKVRNLKEALRLLAA